MVLGLRGPAVLAALSVAVWSAGAVEGSGNYLIVVPEDYAGSAPMVQFTDAKADRGFDVSTLVIPPGTSNATIKGYIADTWGTLNAPDYVLLVGDTAGTSSTSDTIPHWVGGGTKSATTDLPYACMHGGDDWYPDLAVGRFAVSSPGELQAVVDKTLFVEAGVFLDPEYVKRAAFLASSDTGSGAEETHDWVINNYIEPAGYIPNKIYANDGGDTGDITAAVNAGSLFMVYFGHSSGSGWWAPAFNQGNIESLSNDGLYGLVFGFSCNTARFDSGECFGETWIREANKGAAAYISASTFIYYGGSQWESSRRLEKYFFESFFVDDIWEVGPAWQAGLYRLLADPDYGSGDVTRNMFEMFVLLGDPSLKLPKYGGGFDMRVTPFSDLASEGPSGGPFAPHSKTYTVSNNADTPITVSVAANQPWVDIDHPGETIPAEGSVDVTVSINEQASGLPDGGYEATVDFVNITTGSGDTARSIALEVGVPVPIYSFPLDTDPGWLTEGLWAYGQPLGGGGSHGSPDPTAGHTGPNVYGYNLEGDYESNLPERHLTTSAIDCSGLYNVQLVFQRWLGVESPSYDHAYVRVSTDRVNWVPVWTNSGEVSDSSWSEQSYDISAVADNEPTVYLRWTMGTTDGIWNYCGWNIDDVEIWGIEMTPATGDFDDDGDVDLVDFRAFQECFGQASDGTCEPGNLAGGATIDLDDFALFCTAIDGP